MPISSDEPVCPKFQPNIFDPSRCHDCLRQRHLHTGTGESAEVASQQKSSVDTGTGTKTEISSENENGIGPDKGVWLTPIPSQVEERDTSGKEDSDGLSVVSSYCDVSGGRRGYEESSLCILSPDCALYICDGDDDNSTVSSRDQSDSQEFSSSVSTEDEYLPIRRHSTLSMTRLDPPPHRPNPRAWMDEARSRDTFSRHSGLKEDKEKRESGYFSLGKASGTRPLQDSSPPAPYRYFERGHPIFCHRNIEPKDTIPFRNPNLGVASERVLPDPVTEDIPVEIPPPDPYEIAVEVEAQVGPRSPSPTPFKIAESLASTSRKGVNSSYGRKSPTSQMSSYQQSGRFDSSRQGSALTSRSSSPSRGNLAFRRSESTTSLNRHNLDGGGRSRATEPAPKSSLQSSYARRGESGTLPRNFKSFASSIRPQSSTVSDFRSALRKSEGSESSNGRVQPSRNSSPTRRDYNPPSQMSVRKTEANTEANSSTSYARGRESRSSSPSQKSSDSLRGIRNASLPRRTHDTSSHSIIRKSESVWSLNGRGYLGRCGSPIREGYDIESQTVIRNQISNYGTNEPVDESPAMSPSKGFDTASKSVLRKTETASSSRSYESRSSSPGRRSYDSPSQRRRTDTSGSSISRDRESRNSSPVRRNFEALSLPLLRKSEGNSSVRNRDSRSSSPSRRSYDAPEPRSLRTSHTSIRDFSPPRRDNRDPPGHSVLRNAKSGDNRDPPGYSVLRNTKNGDNRDPSGHSVLRNAKNGNNRDPPGHSVLRNAKNGDNRDPSGHSVLRNAKNGDNRDPSGHSVLRNAKNGDNRDPPGHSVLRNAKNGDNRDPPGHSVLRNAKNGDNRDPPGHSVLRNAKNGDNRDPPGYSVHRNARNGDNRDPPGYSVHRNARNGDNRDPPGYSVHRKAKNRDNRDPPGHSVLRNTKNGDNRDPPGHSVLRNAKNGDSGCSFQKKNTYTESKSDPNHSFHSWRESTHSNRSSSLSRAASPSRPTTNGSRVTYATMETTRNAGSVRSGVNRRGNEDHSPFPNDKWSSRARSPSPSPQVEMRRYTSQSSIESSESGQLSVGSPGHDREEYAIMGNLPKVRGIHDSPSQTERAHTHQPARRQELFKPASHSISKHPSRGWDDTGDTDREYAGSGCLSRAHSSTSLQRSGSPTGEESTWKSNHHRSEHMQPDLLNFKKGWMSKLDDSGEWKKHWFVLTDAGLRYYRDSSAEEKDDLDGEIDLKSCTKVSELDVEKNYGFQIHTREAVFTLSAMTAGIRRNWIEVLKKCVQPSSSPDLTQLPDSNSDKENSHVRSVLFSRQSSEHSTTTPSSHRRFDYVELSPVPASSSPLPASQREAGEGQGREHSQWQEERNTSSQWEALLSRKTTGGGSNQRLHMEDEIERKWAEFERLPLKEMSSLKAAGSRSSSQSANETLQREVASLRQQLEHLQRGGGQGGGRGEGGVGAGGCGPEAPCGRSLSAMERAHRQALEELKKQRDRQMEELQAEKDRLLLEETQATARVIETLKKNHKEELEKVKRLGSGVIDSHSLRTQLQAEIQSLQRELAGLSERYSQKCLELNRAEQNNAEREREVSRKERDMEQLRKENQELKNRLAEEISRVQATVTHQGSDDNKGRTSCEQDVLLRVKENEIEYLHKEISCLRNELQFLNTEKRLACERYTEVHEELTGMKGRSEREIQSLREHLRLAMAALQEGQKLGNSLDH